MATLSIAKLRIGRRLSVDAYLRANAPSAVIDVNLLTQRLRLLRFNGMAYLLAIQNAAYAFIT